MSEPVNTITPIRAFRFRASARRIAKWKGIILHWTAGTSGAAAAVSYAGREGSGGWYHYIVDRSLIAECIPTTHRAAHAGAPWNDHYIGIASAQPIYPGWSLKGDRTRAEYDRRMAAVQKRWAGRGETLRIVDYPRQRSTPTVFALDPGHAQQLVRLCAAECERHGIPKRVYVTDRPGAFVGTLPEGVIFHHQASSKGKWDCIPWLPVFEVAFAAAGFEVVP